MRQRYFALKYVRLLTKTAAAQELGASTCWLLSLIACQEDVKSFTEPAKFYFSQLMPLCGFGSPKQLRLAIAKAVELGWLDYVPGSKGIPGRFSVRVPEKFAEVVPFGCDESSDRVPSAETKAEMQTVMGALSGNESTANRQRKRKRNGNTSLPITTSIRRERPKRGSGQVLFSDDDTKTAKWMFGLIQSINPGHKQPSFDKWSADVRLLRERDHRTDQEIRRLFAAANSDTFWRKNILSPTKLRAQWDKLVIALDINPSAPNEHKPFVPSDGNEPFKPRVRAV